MRRRRPWLVLLLSLIFMIIGSKEALPQQAEVLVLVSNHKPKKSWWSWGNSTGFIPWPISWIEPLLKWPSNGPRINKPLRFLIDRAEFRQRVFAHILVYDLYRHPDVDFFGLATYDIAHHPHSLLEFDQ